MSQKQNKKNGSASGSTPTVGGTRLLPEEIEQVRELIAGRHSKAALQLAKDLYKRCATAEAEGLLIEGYKARIDDLVKLGMTVEAKSLLGVVRERFPAAMARLAEVRREISAADGRLEDVVAPLADPGLPAQDRERIEAFIRQRIHDLPALAGVSSLPPEHPLRVAASALAEAFQAVTRGPVDDALLALPEVSRRSPLASWKALLRAIACYHRKQDEECGKWLLTIADDAVPARLIPAFTAMLPQKSVSGSAEKLSPAQQRLVAAAGDHGAALRAALTEVEGALHGRKPKRILDAARRAMAASAHCSAELRERLRQHITVRCGPLTIQEPALNAAMGGAPKFDAYYFRLLARGLEDRHSEEDCAEAATVWADFRREAIKEKWFAPGGLEDGVLSLHMAELIGKAPAEVVEELKEELSQYRRPGKGEKKEEWLPSPGTLYERACKADPHPEAFQAWLNWARKQSFWQSADDVAERWREARATDIQPLLYLMESAEKRNAFKKSLKYLEEAEALDHLNPEVRRAKLRLLLAAALRHLQQRKTHLAQREIEQIATVPEVRPGEIAALVAALRWCAGAVDKDKPAQTEQEAKLSQSVGAVAAHLLCLSLADAAEIGPTASLPALRVGKVPAAALLQGAARISLLGQWAGLPIRLPETWKDPLLAALELPNCPVDAAQMLILGETALASGCAELGYGISTAGLANGGAKAEFLFLRARSLPLWATVRREGCLTASLELARRERNTELAGRILDQVNGKKGGRRWVSSETKSDPGIASRAVSPELLGKILEEEQALKQYPGYTVGKGPKYAEQLGYSLCDCPKCRAKRGESVDDDEWSGEDDEEDEDEFDDEDDDEDEFDEPPPSFYPDVLAGIAKMMGLSAAKIKQLKEAMARGEDPKAALDRILGKKLVDPGLPAPSQNGKKEKAARVPPPEQGSLF